MLAFSRTHARTLRRCICMLSLALLGRPYVHAISGTMMAASDADG